MIFLIVMSFFLKVRIRFCHLLITYVEIILFSEYIQFQSMKCKSIPTELGIINLMYWGKYGLMKQHFYFGSMAPVSLPCLTLKHQIQATVHWEGVQHCAKCIVRCECFLYCCVGAGFHIAWINYTYLKGSCCVIQNKKFHHCFNKAVIPNTPSERHISFRPTGLRLWSGQVSKQALNQLEGVG